MPKLHELLAVQGNQKGQADKTRTELMSTFEKKRHLFAEKIVVFRPSDEDGKEERTQESDLQTTVRKELEWITGMIAPALDTAFQIEKGNQVAKADVELEDGTILLKDVPATGLLELEKRAGEFLAFAQAIPTLDGAKSFQPDPDRGVGIYKARETSTKRTTKKQRPVVLYDATENHPAQVQLVSEDIVTGTVTAQEWSGLITPAEKGDILERAEALARAIKRARARANEVQVETTGNKIGATLLNYVFKGQKN
jgi:hypothetical protein